MKGIKQFAALLSFGLLLGVPQWAGATPVTFQQSFAGNINFQMTGASRRTADDSNACAVLAAGTSNSATLSGLPAGATIQAAYLYWAGSGSTIDSQITFQATTVTASRSFAETFSNGGTDYDFFSGFADVTALVTGNGSYSFSNLTVNSGAPHCAVSAVLSGWALIVIYEHASEPLRVVNLFDGFEFFRGSRIDLTASNFQIPSGGCAGGGSGDCKFGVISWEGDVGNSATLNGFSENLYINPPPPPPALTDAVNPVNNQYNSTISLPGVTGVPNTTTSYGVDIDAFDLSTPTHVAVGDTSLVTRYESGGDLVWLSAQIFSVRNTPVADLAIDKSHSGNFAAGQQGVYTLAVSNNGPNSATGTITVTDTLPTGLTYVSASGSGWSCGAVGQNVTCTHAGPLASGASAANISLTVDVATSAAPSVNNTATVSNATFDNVSANNSDTDATAVVLPTLSTSTKTVLDLNGGDASPGDTLRYTITINETGGVAVSGVSVTDTISSLLTGFNVVSIPAGATNSSTPGTGPLNVSNITVPAGGSVTLVFDAVIVGSAVAGDSIDNTAVINNPVTSTNTNAVATTVTVLASSIPTTGVKYLYPYYNNSTLSRTVPTVNTTSASVNGLGGSLALSMTPLTQSALTLGSGAMQVRMCMQRVNNTSASRNVTLTLDYTGASTGTIGSQTQNGILGSNGWQVVNFTINLPTDVTLNPGTAIRMTVTNNSTPNINRQIQMSSLNCGAPTSRIGLNANTVINVDSVNVYNANYPAVTTQPSYTPGSTVYLRAVVSDPFGSADINGASIQILDASDSVMQASTAMSLVNDSGVATRTYQYQYTIAGGGAQGYWTARVTANEGTEGTISDLGVGAFQVGLPNISVLKLVSTVSDPINAGVNPKAIPDAVVQYQLQVTNSGIGTADLNSLTIDDLIPSNMQLFLNNPANPVQFTDGSPASGVTFSFISLGSTTDDVAFSNDGGSSFITPSVDVNGYDVTVPPINFIRVTPKGAFSGDTGSGDPNFTLRFRARVR